MVAYTLQASDQLAKSVMEALPRPVGDAAEEVPRLCRSALAMLAFVRFACSNWVKLTNSPRLILACNLREIGGLPET